MYKFIKAQKWKAGPIGSINRSIKNLLSRSVYDMSIKQNKFWPYGIICVFVIKKSKMKQFTYSFFLFLVFLLSFSSCKSSFTKEDRSKLVDLQEQMSQQGFEFEADAVLPFNTQALNNVANDLLIRSGNNAVRIDVQGDQYSLKIVDKEGEFALPFYGERRISGGYGTDTGYNFTADIKNIKSSINEKKGYLSYEFSTRNDAETLDVELQIYQPNNVRLHINSSHRTFIKYEGRLKWLEVEEE